MTFSYSHPLPLLSITLIVQYLVALAYSFVTDIISLGYYFARTHDSFINTSEGHFGCMLVYVGGDAHIIRVTQLGTLIC